MKALLKTIGGNDNQQKEETAAKKDKAIKATQITVKDLLLTMFIGVHEYEQHKKQRVRVNITLDVEYNSRWEEDDIQHVVSYDDVITHIQDLTEDTHFNLVETFAEEIAEICFADERVQKAKVSVEKLDVYAVTSSVGVTIERHRSGKEK